MNGPQMPVPPGYDLVRRLGAGAFGEVVLARHRRLDRQVAIKTILPHVLADPETVDRFRREARVLAATDTPTVVRVFDLTTVEGALQLVMEYVPGRTLSELLHHGRLGADPALVILGDVAEALGEMAGHGVVHRDVKPGNVFVLPDGHAKLGDFGLARALLDDSAFRTAGGRPAGTPAYFPPEVSSGQAEPSERSDAYSFAVMAFETLTGTRPFAAPDAVSMIAAHWDRPPLDPAEALPGIPEPARTALLRGLAKDPEERLLPRDLVARLTEIPRASWPAVPTRVRPPSVQSRTDPTILRPGPPAAVTPAREQDGPRRGFGLRRAVVPAVVLVVGALAAAVLFWERSGELAVESVAVGVLPSQLGDCPSAAFTFDGVISTNGKAGTVTFAWIRPDGVRLDDRRVVVGDGQREVTAQLVFEVDGESGLRGEAVLDVVAPQAASAARRIRYRCTGASP